MSEGNAAVSARELVKPGVFGMRSARYVTDLVSEHGGLLAALIVISVLFAPRFASVANILDILRQMAFTGIIGLGMTLVIIAGEIDISVGSAVAFASALFGVVAVNWGWPFPVAAVGVLLATTVIGLCAGAVRAIFGVPSFIVTLALFSALKGGALLLTDAIPIPILDDNFNWWETGVFMGLPVPALILAILFVIFSVIANRTSFGRSVYTIGDNAEAAYLSGVPVAAARTVLFGLTGFLAGVSGLLQTSRLPPEMPGWASVSNSRSSLRSSSEGEPVRRQGFDARDHARRLVHRGAQQRNGSLRREYVRPICRKRSRRIARGLDQRLAVAGRRRIRISIDPATAIGSALRFSRREPWARGSALNALEIEMQPKFNLTATLHAKPEKRADLLKLLTSFVGKSRSEQGCVDYHFHVSLDDPNMFYFYENWAERADFDRHIALDYQKNWFAKQADYLAKPVELRFFEMLSPYDK